MKFLYGLQDAQQKAPSMARLWAFRGQVLPNDTWEMSIRK